MIGYWHNPVVHLSVCLSVCLSVTLCILALRVGVRGWKLHLRVPSKHVPICPFRHFCSRMYCLATKCTTKKRNEKRHKCHMDSGYTCASESKRHGSFVNNDTVLWTVRLQPAGPAGAAEVCGLWMQICSNCWIRGLTKFFYSEIFLFRGRDVAITMNIALKYCMQYNQLSQQ